MDTRRIAAAVAGSTIMLTVTACGSNLASPQAPPASAPPPASQASAPPQMSSQPPAEQPTSAPTEISGPQGAPAPTSQDSSAPQKDCGVNIHAPQVKAAIAKVKPFKSGDQTWQWGNAWAGNYDPCATLSTALITIQGATGSSPEQALLFNKGHYLGTATADPRAFMTFNKGATSDDTVAIDYSDRPCTACKPTSVTTVKFHWNGSKVDMIGTPPPS